MRSLFALTIFFALNIVPHSGYALTLEASCQQAGGEIKGRGCYCGHTSNYVNPQSERCLSAQISAVAKQNKPGLANSGNCDPTATDKAPESTSELAAPASEICSNPAKFFCDGSLNPFVPKLAANEAKFDRIITNAENDPTVAKFISEKSNGTLKTCSQLSVDDWRECSKKVEAVIHKQLYTPERKQKAEALLKKAKNSVLGFLEKERKVLLAAKDRKGLATLDKMAAKINEAKLHFGPYAESDGSTFNATFKTIIPKSEQRWYQFITGGMFNSTIYLEGMILNVDQTPDALYGTLMHELGHSIGPLDSEFRKDENYTDNPFQKQLMCLKHKNSVGAKKGDAACYERLAKKYESKDPEIADLFKTASKYVKQNPDVAWSSPSLEENEQCQSGQLNEAFADFVEAESFILANKLPSANESAENSDIKKLLAEMPELASLAAGDCSIYKFEDYIGATRSNNLDSHPIHADRLNAILLVNPKLTAALGCPANSTSSYDFSSGQKQSIPEGIRLYCGREQGVGK